MKICLISNLYNPYIIGGAEINTERLAKALNKDEDVFVITTKPFKNPLSLLSKRGYMEGVKVYRFYPLNLYHMYFSKKRKIPVILKALWHVIDIFNIHSFLVTIRILKREKPDIVHTSNLDGLSFSIFWAVKLLGIPLVHTLHDYHLLCPYANLVCPFTRYRICNEKPYVCSLYSFLEKKIVDSLPKVVITPSSFIIKKHISNGFFTESKSEIIPYFVELEDGEDVSLGDKGTLDFLYVGNISQIKGVKILLDSFQECSDKSIRLHLVGDGPYVNELKKYLGRDLRIKWYGRKPNLDMKSFYSKSDILIIPSIWYDNFPIVILEAFSLGLPVIASKIGGIPEQAKDGYNGFLIAPNNKKELKDKILDLARKPKVQRELLLENLSKGAYNSYKNYYTRDKVMKKITDEYKSCIYFS